MAHTISGFFELLDFFDFAVSDDLLGVFSTLSFQVPVVSFGGLETSVCLVTLLPAVVY